MSQLIELRRAPTAQSYGPRLASIIQRLIELELDMLQTCHDGEAGSLRTAINDLEWQYEELTDRERQ